MEAVADGKTTASCGDWLRQQDLIVVTAERDILRSAISQNLGIFKQAGGYLETAGVDGMASWDSAIVQLESALGKQG